MTAGHGPAVNARKCSSDQGRLPQKRCSWETKLSWGRKNNIKQNDSECVLNTDCVRPSCHLPCQPYGDSIIITPTSQGLNQGSERLSLVSEVTQLVDGNLKIRTQTQANSLAPASLTIVHMSSSLLT